jgi:hypothetical protein
VLNRTTTGHHDTDSHLGSNNPNGPGDDCAKSRTSRTLWHPGKRIAPSTAHKLSNACRVCTALVSIHPDPAAAHSASCVRTAGRIDQVSVRMADRLSASTPSVTIAVPGIHAHVREN